MGWLIFILFNTLAGAAIWYFVCGLKDNDEQSDNNSNAGCFLSLILGFIGALIVSGMAALGVG